MQLPITEEKLKEFEAILRKKEDADLSEERIAHAKVVAKLINDAYYQGRSESGNK